ncbi:MAG: 4Fe-4S dicluster domain-containing protein [Desulfobacterales bacterium]|nr:MAG: 4Fe-4S dicluster domain-containing protein [Desulfobacterales bacterium]
MTAYLTPNPKLGRAIEAAVHAEGNLCWTCNSCLTECPVNIATNRMQPLKIVRMATLGLLDELLRLPEIWYCITCNRCSYVCPMSVKPAAIIRYLRQEVARHKLVAYATITRYRELFSRFQRTRWHMAQHCLNGFDLSLNAALWHQWLETPVQPSADKIASEDLFRGSKAFRKAAADNSLRACLTCCECASACPIFCERSVFDPVWIFRMANWGLADELLDSPSIWLCIACQRCTDACSQQIKGHHMIRRLQELAVEEGFVGRDFPSCWKKADYTLYPFVLEEIDALFGFPAC